MTMHSSWVTTFPYLLLFLAAPATSTVMSDFSFYPPNSIACLNQASAIAQCQGATTSDLNACLCGNTGNWILNSAACVGKNDPEDVVSVYTVMASACAETKTPMSVSQSDFYAAANGTLAKTTTSTSTASTATSTALPSKETTTTSGGGLSTGATVGLAVGASIGGVAIMAGIVFFLVRGRSTRSEEGRPMMMGHAHDFGGETVPQGAFDHRYSAATTFPPTEPSPGYSSVYEDEAAKRPASSWPLPFPSRFSSPFEAGGVSSSSSPDPLLRHHGVESYPPPPPGGIVELPPHPPAQIFEMDSNASSVSQPLQRLDRRPSQHLL